MFFYMLIKSKKKGSKKNTYDSRTAFFQASLEKALYMWRGEGFVYVERRRLCICREKKALYMWRGEGFVYVEKRRLCISGEVTTTVLKTCSTTQYLSKKYLLVAI